MFVSDWMSKRPVTAGPDDYLSEAITLMKENTIKHLPVVKKGKLVGVISDRDIKEYSPSTATCLDVYELHYLLANTRIREAMRTKLVTVTPETPIEEAALLLLEHNIGCLPVIRNGELAGIIADHDIYRALVDITGVRHGGHRICAVVEDRPGSIRELGDIIRKHNFHLQGILTSYEGVKRGYRKIVIRTTEEGNFRSLKTELEETFKDVQISK